MIDIHTHIIPDLDDGPADMETSVAMGRVAAEEGIAAMISTSHSEEGARAGYEEMQRRLQEVQVAWAAAGVDIRLELGLEIFLTPQTRSELEAGRLWTMAGSAYVLVELPYQPWPTYAERTLFDLQVGGYVPILAHPERYTAIQADPNLMYSLAERGVLSQVTAAALLGQHGHAIKRTTEILLRHNLAQFISSDAHGLTSRLRLPKLLAAREAAEKLVGADAARALVMDNPACILDRKPISFDPQRISPRKWSLGNIFKGE
jgi:protein-tyrosine phosphatase